MEEKQSGISKTVGRNYAQNQVVFSTVTPSVSLQLSSAMLAFFGMVSTSSQLIVPHMHAAFSTMFGICARI
jgi:hypothetical protein